MGLRIGRGSLGSVLGAAIAPAAFAACLALALLSARPAAAAASSWIGNPQSQLRLISSDSVAPRQGELRLGVQFRLAPRWHVYWKNSGDAGFAPVITWKAGSGLGPPPELLWPAPHRFELPGGLEAFGYAGEVVYPVRAVLDAAPGSSRLRLAANVDYLVCEIDCVPYRYDLSLDQPLGERARLDPQTAALIAGWWRQVPLALAAARLPDRPGAPAVRERAAASRTAGARQGPASARLPGSPGAPDVTAQAEIVRAGPSALLLLEIRLRGVDAAPKGADLFFETHPALELGRPRVIAAPAELRFEAPVRRKNAAMPLPAGTEIAWTATGLQQTGRQGPLALAARQWVPIVVPGEVPGEVTSAGPPAMDQRPAGAVEAGRPAAARHGLRVSLAAADPRAPALGAVAAALLTLEAWGLLRARRPAVRTEAAGFLALLLTLALLYALSLEISAEGLAGVEAALLAMALVAWLRGRIDRPALARTLLAAGLAACAIVPPLVAARNRLTRDVPAAAGVPAAGDGNSPRSTDRHGPLTQAPNTDRRFHDA
ncbi:MAG TPA: protein-disulfide reductase DsbD domain-containing protein [Thermoanaerobaculia bacterium]|nr:protein-disulfide reductase DsbD domain-containing protein [Thermoanaerobaculia bacterium]